MSEFEYYAKQYAAAGLAVIPLKQDKTPYTAHGLKDATTSEDTIEEWWQKWPKANIGIATGQVSGGVCVIDQDEKNGEHGIEVFEKWVDDNFLYIDDTWTSRTASGGKHTFFKSTVPVMNRIGWLDGVDVRGDGGYIVAPPSMLADGSEYTWISSPFDLEFPVSNEEDPNIDFIISEINRQKFSGTPLQVPETIIQGGRNDMLYKLACSLQRKGVSDSAIFATIRAENAAKCDPPLSDTEIDKLVRSALTKPKGDPEPQTAKADPEVVKNSKMDFPPRELFSAKTLMDTPDKELTVYVGDDKVPLLSEGTVVLAAPPKLGKSWFCLNLAIALTTGSDFLGYKTKRCHVQYYDLEQSRRLKRKRLKMLVDRLGIDVPEGLYMADELQGIGRGFIEQIEYDMQNDPQIGVFIIDVFTYIETARKNTETEYQWTYKNFNVINDLARKYSIAIILVLHTRKGQDPDHPFDNILGSTANQGASSHMIVLAKSKFNSASVHLYAQGRETEGVIELDYINDGGALKLSDTQPDEPDEMAEFMESEIRNKIVDFMSTNSKLKGRCSFLIEELAKANLGVDASPKELGSFLSKNVGRFMKHDGILVNIIKNGTGPRVYEILKNSEYAKTTIDTIDEWRSTIDENPFEPA